MLGSRGRAKQVQQVNGGGMGLESQGCRVHARGAHYWLFASTEYMNNQLKDPKR